MLQFARVSGAGEGIPGTQGCLGLIPRLSLGLAGLKTPLASAPRSRSTGKWPREAAPAFPREDRLLPELIIIGRQLGCWKPQTACVLVSILTWEAAFSATPDVCRNSSGDREMSWKRPSHGVANHGNSIAEAFI